MNIQNNPLTQAITNAISNIEPGGPLDDMLETLGVYNPEAFCDLFSANSLGDVGEAIYEALGFDPQVAAICGITADAVTGNVKGAVENGVEEVVGEGSGAGGAAGTILDLAGQLPI